MAFQLPVQTLFPRKPTRILSELGSCIAIDGIHLQTISCLKSEVSETMGISGLGGCQRKVRRGPLLIKQPKMGILEPRVRISLDHVENVGESISHCSRIVVMPGRPISS